MRKVVLIISIIFVGCKENAKTEKPFMYENTANSVVKSNSQESITLETKKFKDFEFSITSNLVLQSSLSNKNKQVYIDDSRNLGLTIDVSEIPNGNYNSGLEQIIDNINLFGHQIKEGNRRNFSDFQIQNTKYDKLGNLEAILVNQTSTLISGNNTPMKVKSLFSIAYPHYITVTLSNPLSNPTLDSLTNKIKESFLFLNFNRNRVYSAEFLSSHKKWILETLNDNVRYEYTLHNDLSVKKPYTIGRRFSEFYFFDNLLCMDFQTIISEYDNGTEYVIRNFNSTIKLPIEKIKNIYFEENMLHKGKCLLVFETFDSDIQWINHTENKIEDLRNVFAFHIKCQENNFIAKMKTEIENSIH